MSAVRRLLDLESRARMAEEEARRADGMTWTEIVRDLESAAVELRRQADEARNKVRTCPNCNGEGLVDADIPGLAEQFVVGLMENAVDFIEPGWQAHVIRSAEEILGKDHRAIRSAWEKYNHRID